MSTDAKKNNVDVVDELLNPEVRTMVLGTKKTKTINVYPLGYYDQKEIGGKVMASVTLASSENENASELEYISKLSQALEENVPVLVGKCTDLTENKFMSDVTAGQLMEFITIIMEVNFIAPVKKGTRLFVEMGSLYGGNLLSPPSVDITDTPSEISD